MPSAAPVAEPPKTELQELQLKAQNVVDDVSILIRNMILWYHCYHCDLYNLTHGRD